MADVKTCYLCLRKHRESGEYCCAEHEARALPPVGNDLQIFARPYALGGRFEDTAERELAREVKREQMRVVAAELRQREKGEAERLAKLAKAAKKTRKTWIAKRIAAAKALEALGSDPTMGAGGTNA